MSQKPRQWYNRRATLRIQHARRNTRPKADARTACAAVQPCRAWYLDYRVQQMFDSNTSFQSGSSAPLTGPYTPISKLAYSLDSTWTGLRLGVQKPDWDVHFEWLTPIGRGIDRGIVDYDWNIVEPRNDPTRLDSLAQLSTRWNDGQKLELEGTQMVGSFLGPADRIVAVGRIPVSAVRHDRLRRLFHH